VAVQSLAALALLGEGAGDGTRLAAARRGLAPIAHAVATGRLLGGTALGAAALALVEGAVLFDDAALRREAAAALVRFTREMPGHPGEAGLNGLGWLAIEVAGATGIELPGQALEAARRRLAREVPATTDLGRIGLAAYARLINGQRGADSTDRLLSLLAAQAPVADAQQRIDPLSWLFAALALREGGGPAWTAWAARIESAVAASLVVDGTATAHVPAGRVRHADSDTLATALATLVLQAPYRYQPLAP
jgi:hypothetical protein